MRVILVAAFLPLLHGVTPVRKGKALWAPLRGPLNTGAPSAPSGRGETASADRPLTCHYYSTLPVYVQS